MKQNSIQFNIVLKQTEKNNRTIEYKQHMMLVHAFGSQEWTIGIV